MGTKILHNPQKRYINQSSRVSDLAGFAVLTIMDNVNQFVKTMIN